MSEIRLSLFQVSFDFPEGAAIELDVGKARVKYDSLIVIGERTVEIAFGLPRCAAVTPGFRKIGSEFNCMGLIADRAVQIAKAEPGQAAIVVHFGVTKQAFAARAEKLLMSGCRC